jgi:hypothetical protein
MRPLATSETMQISLAARAIILRVSELNLRQICVNKFASTNLRQQICVNKFASTNLRQQICVNKFASTNLRQQMYS